MFCDSEDISSKCSFTHLIILDDSLLDFGVPQTDHLWNDWDDVHVSCKQAEEATLHSSLRALTCLIFSFWASFDSITEHFPDTWERRTSHVSLSANYRNLPNDLISQYVKKSSLKKYGMPDYK